MTQEEKLVSLEDWLSKKGAKFADADGTVSPDARLFVEKPKTAVFVCPPDKEDDNYRAACAAGMRSFFVRDNENVRYIIHKMDNCLKYKTLAAKARREEAARLAAKPRRKRIHTQPSYERVTFKH